MQRAALRAASEVRHDARRTERLRSLRRHLRAFAFHAGLYQFQPTI